jgi:hypothetical protein
VPADHEYFKSTNTAQWYWYLYQIVEDQEEEFRSKRNMVEYQVSFSEPELVKRIRKQREEAESNVKQDKQFADTLKNLFGRGSSFENKPNFSETHEVTDILKRIDEFDSHKPVQPKTAYNYAEWLNFKLE